MNKTSLILKVTEILRENICTIERCGNRVLIYKRPQQAMRNDILQLRTEMISPVQGVEREETAV